MRDFASACEMGPALRLEDSVEVKEADEVPAFDHVEKPVSG